jgi:hypothetical protein
MMSCFSAGPSGGTTNPNVALLLRGENGTSSTLLDSSTFNRSVYSQDTGIVNSTAQARNGAGSVYVPSAKSVSWEGSQFSIATNQAVVLETYVFIPALTATTYIANFSTTEAIGRVLFYITSAGRIKFNVFGQPEYFFGTQVVGTNDWHHLAFVRLGGTNDIICYYDGNSIGSVSWNAGMGNGSPGRLTIVPYDDIFFDDYCLTINENKYTGNFTPPTGGY